LFERGAGAHSVEYKGPVVIVQFLHKAQHKVRIRRGGGLKAYENIGHG
jgi:hypothetical protein